MKKFGMAFFSLSTLFSAVLYLSPSANAVNFADPTAERESVYRIDPAVDGTIIGLTGLAAAVTYFSADRWIRQRCPCNPAEVNSFDRGAIGNANVILDSISDATLGAAILLPPVLDYLDLGFSPELKEDLTIYLETFGINGFLNTAAKYTVQRPLPRSYAGDPELVNKPGGYRSFYSGHTSTTFSLLSAAATTYNLRHHQGWLPWLIVGTVGTSVALERVAAGRHFPTDVMVGAVVGTLVGVSVPYFHQKGEPKFFVTAASTQEGGAVYATVHL